MSRVLPWDNDAAGPTCPPRFQPSWQTDLEPLTCLWSADTEASLLRNGVLNLPVLHPVPHPARHRVVRPATDDSGRCLEWICHAQNLPSAARRRSVWLHPRACQTAWRCKPVASCADEHACQIGRFPERTTPACQLCSRAQVGNRWSRQPGRPSPDRTYFTPVRPDRAARAMAFSSVGPDPLVFG